jgi:nitrile hydratase subunit beta
MNGGHDLGGRHGLGSINPEPPDEHAWHYGWEGRMYFLALLPILNGKMTVDEKRHACERMPAAAYLNSSYYEHWLWAIETVLDEKGIITQAEMEERIASQAFRPIHSHPKFPSAPLSDMAKKALAVINGGTPHDMRIDRQPIFPVGASVRARNLHPKAHLRLPGYAKGKSGIIERHYGAYAHPRDRAHGMKDVPEHLYSVAFTASELWGPDAEAANDTVYIDLFEDYLQAA